MKIIKLETIPSTNDFLKQLSSNEDLENYTIVLAENQTQGKGQMGAKWVSESGKNLILSVFVKDIELAQNKIFNLNFAVSIAIYHTLYFFEIPDLSIKWANDIMSGNKKIAGILIENTFKPNGNINSIIGIGLNVNQLDFDNLPQASSLKNITNKEFDKEKILLKIIENIQNYISLLKENNSKNFCLEYNNLLFRKEIPTVFEANNQKFMGMIQNVSKDGRLHLLLENDILKSFEIKEIKMLF